MDDCVLRDGMQGYGFPIYYRVICVMGTCAQRQAIRPCHVLQAESVIVANNANGVEISYFSVTSNVICAEHRAVGTKHNIHGSANNVSARFQAFRADIVRRRYRDGPTVIRGSDFL